METVDLGHKLCAASLLQPVEKRIQESWMGEDSRKSARMLPGHFASTFLIGNC